MVDGTVPAPVILTTNISAFPVGEAGFVPLQFTNGIRPMYFQVVSGSLPDGLALDSAGAITGTATASGQSSLTIAVTDWLGRNSVQTLTLTRVRIPRVEPRRKCSMPAGLEARSRSISPACRQPHTPF